MEMETPAKAEEAPVSKDLVEKAEKRKLELKKLSSEEYGRRWEQIEDTLDKTSVSFGEINYSDSQMEGMTKNAFEEISKALENEDLTAAQKALAKLKEYKEKMEIHRNMHPSVVISVRQQVRDFIEQFGLTEYVTLKDNVGSEEIKRAIDLGYEAKMWELTNRQED
jgi:hypothetical protein